jgi:hypothetical protein
MVTTEKEWEERVLHWAEESKRRFWPRDLEMKGARLVPSIGDYGFSLVLNAMIAMTTTDAGGETKAHKFTLSKADGINQTTVDALIIQAIEWLQMQQSDLIR